MKLRANPLWCVYYLFYAIDNRGEVISQQNKLGSLTSNVRATAHRNANIRLLQCSRIIDAIASDRN